RPPASPLFPYTTLFRSRLPNGIVNEGAAKLTKETFGDLRVYYEGPTDQLKSMTAGSLRLKPGMSPHPPHQHPEEEFIVITEGTGDRKSTRLNSSHLGIS